MLNVRPPHWLLFLIFLHVSDGSPPTLCSGEGGATTPTQCKLKFVGGLIALTAGLLLAVAAGRNSRLQLPAVTDGNIASSTYW